MFTVTNVGAIPGSEAFLLLTPEKTALLDSGFSFCAPQMLEKISGLLGSRELDYVLLTHSHYDHASGSIYCKGRWPGATIVGSQHTAKIFGKDSARDLMRRLNDSAARLNGQEQYLDCLADLRVDRSVVEGDVIDLGSMQLRVLELPGHTRCSIGFYAEKDRLLLACETLGVVAGPDLVMPCCLVSYQLTLQAVERVAALPLQHMLLPHLGLLEGEDCARFLTNARYWLEESRRRLRAAAACGGTDAELLQAFKDMFYTPQTQQVQPEVAFDLN
ncbi:MAG: MBL fold metallo-hydrolase, partial [Oligosphaeraceae bacterium]|nr:MBL fold metallo-hydrolase [Oligosphaeraceae bacterium]